MESSHYLYVILFPNGKRYFGITKNPSRRWTTHRRDSRNGCSLLVHKALHKYGVENCEFKILQSGSKEEMESLEIARIARYKTWVSRWRDEFGYNIKPGGNLGPCLKGELNPMFGRRGKLNPNFGKPSKTKGKAIHSAEYNQRNRAMNTGENNPMYGRRHSEEAKAKQRAAALRRFTTE